MRPKLGHPKNTPKNFIMIDENDDIIFDYEIIVSYTAKFKTMTKLHSFWDVAI